MLSKTFLGYTYKPRQALFYINPTTGKLAIVSFVSYLGRQPDKPVIYNKFTGLNQVVDPARLLTGREDKPKTFWDNLERYPDPSFNPELIDDLTARIALGI